MKTIRSSISRFLSLRTVANGLTFIGLLALASAGGAADIYRADNANTLDDPLAWKTGATPTDQDIAVWDNTVQVNVDSTLDYTGLGTNWAGIRIADPGTNISILPGGILTLGASGIDLGQLTNINLTLTCPVNLAATQTWNIATNRAVIVSAAIGDSDGLGKQLIKGGLGTLTISAGTTFTLGGIQVNGGTLDPGNGLVASVGTITLNGGTWSMNGTANSNPLQVNDGTTNLLIAENNCGVFGPWTGGGTVYLNINASGRVMTMNSDMSGFNGAIRFAPGTGLGSFRANNAANIGGTNITFDLGNNGSGTLNKNTGAGTFYIGALFGGPNTTLTSGQVEDFDIGYKSDSVFSGNINGANVALIKSGPTTLVLAGANSSYGRGTTISNGVLQVGNGGASGRLGNGSITNYATLAFNRSDTFTFANMIQGSGNVSNAGSGTLILAANNTHTGKTIVSGGTLVLAQQAALGAIPGVFTADHLTLNGGALGATNDFSLSDSTRGITLGANGGGLAPNAGATLTLPNPIAGTGNLTVNNSGTVALTALNSYTGKTIVKSGTLRLGAEEPLGANPAVFTADQLTLDGGTLRSTATFAINDANRGISIASGGGTLSADVATMLTLASPVAGSGTLTVSGAGTANLNAANPLSGNIVISQGTLALGASGTIANVPSLSLASGAALDVTAAGLSLAAGQTVTGSGTVTGNLAAGTGSTLSPGASIGQLNVNGTLTMGGGTMLVELNSTTNDVINVTGNLVRTGTSTFQCSLLSGLTSGRRVLIRYTGTLSGAGSFVLAGAPGGSTVDTSVPNEVALVLNINSADLTWVGDGSLNVWDTTTPNWTAGAGAVTFSPFDNVTFNDSGSQSPAVNITGAVLPNNVTVNAAGNYTFSGTGRIGGVANLTKNNSGTLTILTANDYSGTTLLAQGLVQVGNGGTGGSLGAGALTNNTTLIFNLPGSGTQSGDVTGSGSLTLQAGTLTLAGNSSYTGTTTNAGGATLQVGAGGSTGSLGSGAVQNDGSLVFNTTGTITNSGAVSGTGTLTKQGPGTVALAANNGYSGATTISAGTLQVGTGGASGTLGTAGAVTDNGTLAFNRSDNITASIVINGAGALEQKGPGTLTVVSTNTYSGGTIISGGRLQLGDGAAAAALGTGSISNNGTLIVSRPDDFFLTNVISGTGSLVKVGANTLRFNNGTANPNTYSGGTILSNGIIRLGPDTEGDPGQANANSLGTGPATFYGGTLRVYNHTSQLFCGTAFANPIVIPTNQAGTVLAPQNGAFLPSSVTGSGTLAVVLNATATPRNTIGGDWSAFEGQMIAMGDIGFRVSATDFGNASIVISNITTLGSVAGNNVAIRIGELTGIGTLGMVDQGSTAPTWVIGSKNTAATFDGVIADASALNIVKVGTNTWTLTGISSYTGNTTVSNGVLALSTNSAGIDASIASSSVITIAAPGVLDVTRLSTGTLDVMTTLAGNGTNRGAVHIYGNLAPGFDTNGYGNLTITGGLVVDGSVNLDVDHVTGPVCDQVTAPSITVNSIINVSQLAGSTNALITGDTFQLFSGPVAGPGAAAPNLPWQNFDGSILYVWTNRLAIDGTIQLLQGGTNLAPNPTNLTCTAGGGQMTLMWPAGQGWRLQSQTNPLSAGLGTNWVDVAGSAATNQMALPMGSTNGAVFFRLVYP